MSLKAGLRVLGLLGFRVLSVSGLYWGYILGYILGLYFGAIYWGYIGVKGYRA